MVLCGGAQKQLLRPNNLKIDAKYQQNPNTYVKKKIGFTGAFKGPCTLPQATVWKKGLAGAFVGKKYILLKLFRSSRARAGPIWAHKDPKNPKRYVNKSPY